MSDNPAFDHDNPEWTEADFARAKPADTLPAHVLAAFPKTKRVSDIPIPPITALVAAQRGGARLGALAA